MNVPEIRVLLVASYPESIMTFRGALIRDLLSRGCEVHVAAPELGPTSSIAGCLRVQGVVCHEIALQRNGTSLAADLRLLSSMVSLCRRVRPDTVLAYTIKPVIYGMIGSWLVGVRQRVALITGLGYAFTGRDGLLSRLIRHLYAFALARASLVFFQNSDDRDLFLAIGVLDAGSRSFVINGSGVDLSDFAVRPLPIEPVRFLMIARLLGDKGVREFAAAATRVKAAHPHCRFHLVGWIDSNPDAISESELGEWVESGAVEFHGKLEDVRPAIMDSTVYVLPSYREGTPRTVLEAMAMGRPIITTDAPGCRETVIDGENGYLVPIKSVDALVEAMQRFIVNPGLADRMGQRSRQIAEDKYDVQKVNAVMLREMGITGLDTGKETQA